MPALNPEHLLELAEREISPQGEIGAPRQANLRRGISTAYYAVFHSLCGWVSLTFAHGNRETEEMLYRALDHGPARTRCEEVVKTRGEDPFLRELSDAFVQLQQKRHDADYNPQKRFTRQDARSAVVTARDAINALERADPTRRLVFLAGLLSRARR